MKRPAIRWFIPFGLAALVSSFAYGCGEDTSGTIAMRCPDAEVFASAVSPYLERRCGSLDCHGNRKRPLRFYSQFGHRHPSEANVSGGNPTTDIELDANYNSVCGLEPEEMGEVIDDFGQSAEVLQLLAKPRGLIHHKGGQVVAEGDNADSCILGWLRNDPADTVQGLCDAALDQISQ